MSKMMPNITNKLRRKKPSVTVESPSGKEPDAKESKSLVKAATGALPCSIIAYRSLCIVNRHDGPELKLPLVL